MISKGLFVAKFDIQFPTFLEAIPSGKDYLLKFQCEETGMIYPMFFEVNSDITRNIVSVLIGNGSGDSVASIEGHLKIDKRGQVILRAKKIKTAFKDFEGPLGLYRTRFDLNFPVFQSKELLGDDYLLKFLIEETGSVYPVFYSSDNEISKRTLENLKPGVRCNVEGFIKVDKRDNIILRAKKIITDIMVEGGNDNG